GYLPAWAKPGAGMHTVINARIESIAEKKPYFRGAFHSARCAILADGFYEWKKVRGGKQPYRITLKDGGVFAFAGLWSHVNTGDGSERATCAIITVEPNELMSDIHNRMPAILTPADLSVWLDPKARERDLYAAVEPYPSDLLRAYPVSTVMNSAAHDAPDCIAPITGDEA
ncbi:MAG: SOS response-associated peptidase, partial [Candidatus Kapaibacterium sp.]